MLILDEIGLAEVAATNPLKVLHRLLEDKSNVPMIALSNWSLDASKMNRTNFTNRPKLTEAELIEAALAIRNRIQPEGKRVDDEILKDLANDFYVYSETFNSSARKAQANAFFHGTRDFYYAVTSVCLALAEDSKLNTNLDQRRFIILRAILRNFGGKRELQQTLSFFSRSLRFDNQESLEAYYNEQRSALNSTSLIK